MPARLVENHHDVIVRADRLGEWYEMGGLQSPLREVRVDRKIYFPGGRSEPFELMRPDR